MGVRKMHLEGPCPACQERKLNYTAADLDMPYFQNVTQLIIACEACGFRHNDFLIGTLREPTRCTYRVTQADDMMVRVVRSTSGTVRIPELGVLIEPGPASDAYVTNIEGILVRVQGVLTQLCRDAEDDRQRRDCEKRLEDLQAAREGRFPFTFILEDPYGNSLVAHEQAKTEPIPVDQASVLKTGEYTQAFRDEVDSDGGSRDGHGNGARSTS